MNTVTLELTQGKTALIDECDLPLVSQYSWHAVYRKPCWYAASSSLRRKTGQALYLHRLIMDAKPDEHVDHKNGNGLDCRRENMRICTNAQNRMNNHSRTGKSAFKGVWFSAKNANRQWRANISVGDKTVHLGGYETEAEAARAYNAAALKHYGEFACLNEIPGMTYEESITAPPRVRQGRGPDMKKRKRRSDIGVKRKESLHAA